MTGSIPRVAATGNSAGQTGSSAGQPGSNGQTGSNGPGDLVLVLNSGSSSVKFAVLSPDSGDRVLDGMAEKVGMPEAGLRVRRHPAGAVEETLPEGSYHAVISRILDHLADIGPAQVDSNLQKGTLQPVPEYQNGIEYP